MAELKATFRVIGGLTRSTVGTEPPDPLEDALHWIWSWRVQVTRLEATTAAQGQGATPIERRQSFSSASFDEHILAVTGWNLARALSAAAPHLPEAGVAQRTRDALRLLRNLYEHWNDQRHSFQSAGVTKNLSGAAFVTVFPDGKPWSITYVAGDWLLGGVLGIGELTRQLGPIEAAILKVQEEASK